jgi:hypothetical protein
VVWHSDFLVETSVLSQASRHRSLYDRLARQLAKMTARPEYGRAHVPWVCLMELAAAPNPERQAHLGVLLNLRLELGDRLSVTGNLENSIAREWEEPRTSATVRWDFLEPELVECVRTGGAGTKLDAAGEDFRRWREEHHQWHAEAAEEMQAKYREEPGFRRALQHLLTNGTREEMLGYCDDIVGRYVSEATGREKDDAIAIAKSNPDRYWVTWTYAVLVRFAQYAQTIPSDERARGPFGGYGRMLRDDKNDFNDAQLAAVGGPCGMLITEDRGLRERINFLQRRGFLRLQAFNFSDAEANWHEPGWRPSDET